MIDSRANILLHPVRLRIVQAIQAGGQMTVRQISHILNDVPQASVYRHLNMLVDGGFVLIVNEQPVGGAMERVYAVEDGATMLTKDDFTNASKADHIRYFTTFCATLMNKFDRYLTGHQPDVGADGVGYFMRTLFLNDEEFDRLTKSINRLLEEAAENEPTPDRRSRLFATVSMPDDDDLLSRARRHHTHPPRKEGDTE